MPRLAEAAATLVAATTESGSGNSVDIKAQDLCILIRLQRSLLLEPSN